MHLNLRKSLATCVVALIAALSGCAKPEPTALPEAATTAPAAMPAPSSAVEDASETDAEASITSTALVITPTSATAAADPAPTAPPKYEPPFPDRIDLFVAPKRQGGTSDVGANDNAVDLLGFVRVDRQRAVLSINGEISPLAKGESLHGVEVISITPPNVVLQRGRQRWQATLE